MGFWDSVFGSSSAPSTGGGGNILGDVLGGLSTASQIYNTYSSANQLKDQKKLDNSLTQQRLDEERRQFDLTYGLKQKQLELASAGGSGGGGNGDALKIAKSNAIANAYQAMIDATKQGRDGEASILSKLIDQFRAANSMAR